MTPREELVRTVGQITKIRKQRGWSIQELAYRAEMERSSLSDIEAGKTDIRFTTLCRIAAALAISVKDLVR
jgi:transcriptional regulator with XRE-family HTH domain